MEKQKPEKHGMSHTPEYEIFKAAKYRCTNPNNQQWSNYGGRGIEFRFKSLTEFLAALGGMRPTPQHVLDRIDNDGHYEAGNVRWVLLNTSMVNRRKSALNTSGFRGVHPHASPTSPWKAEIRVNGVCHYLGLFASPIEAAQAYDLAAKVHRGADALLNFPDAQAA